MFKAFFANPECGRECSRIVELMKTGANPHVRSVRLDSNHLGWLYFLHCYFTTLCRMELFQRKLGCHSYMSLIELYGFFKKITWCQLFIKQSTNQSINNGHSTCCYRRYKEIDHVFYCSCSWASYSLSVITRLIIPPTAYFCPS